MVIQSSIKQIFIQIKLLTLPRNNNIGLRAIMSIVKNIKQQIANLLNQPQIQINRLQKELDKLVVTLQPTARFPHLNEVESKEPQIVFASLTVQDILEPQYYYSYLIQKPIHKNSQIHVLKYGYMEKQPEDFKMEKYQAIMDSRETLICVSDFYQTQWIQNEWKGQNNIQKPINLKVSGRNQFKLGQKINAVCVWNPQDKVLIFVRKTSPQQILKQKLMFEASIPHSQINVKQIRQRLIQNLEQFCTKPQSLILLLSMISDQPIFLNGQNIYEQISQILPRVNHVKIKAPFKQSLFPYKNPEGELIRTSMQMSSAKTFVIIDFSEFSQQKEIKIEQVQIDNLKALKMFVEQGKTVFRWQYGESLIDHIHSGIIIKGSKIVNPNFFLSEQFIQKTQKQKVNPFKDMNKQLKHKIRVYIQKCLSHKAGLIPQQRAKIEADMKQQIAKFPNQKLMIAQRMQLAKLVAKSYCRDQISFQDYRSAKQLLKI